MAESQESLAWDRVGRFLEDTGSTASDIARRNLDLWSSISQRLRKADSYKADNLAGDLAGSLVTAMDNLDDIVSLVSRSRIIDGQGVHMPTVLFFFESVGNNSHTLPQATAIQVNAGFRSMDLPGEARVEISARFPLAGDLGSDRPDLLHAGAARLRESIRAFRSDDGSSYVLQAINRQPPDNRPPAIIFEAARAGEDGSHPDDVAGTARSPEDGEQITDGLVPGVYDGLVFLTNPTIALADLRIVVEAGQLDDRGDGRPAGG